MATRIALTWRHEIRHDLVIETDGNGDTEMARFATASCTKAGDIIEMDDPEFETEAEAERAVTGHYIKVASNLFEASPGVFACIVDTW